MDEVNDEFNLHEAAAAGLIEECRQLVAAGKDVNSVDLLGWTPLMHAVRNGHFLVARDLLSHGASVDIQNHHGVTVFTLAALDCEEDLLNVLYHGLTQSDLQQNESNNALQVASVRGNYSTARWLLTNTNAEISMVSKLTGVSPLHLSVMGHHYKLAEMLIRFGADATITSALGQNVFELATAFGNRRLLEILYKDISPMQEMHFDFNKDISKPTTDCIDSRYTCNNLYLDLHEDVFLKNSPCRPVFKTGRGDNELESSEPESTVLMSPCVRSVFSPAHQTSGVPLHQPRSPKEKDYSLQALISPMVHPFKSPNRGKKRKLLNNSGCSSWLKRLTKRRSKSVNDNLQNIDDYEDSFDFDFLKPSGIDFSHLLINLGLEDFFPTFREHELDIWTFLTLTKEDLEAMGLHDPESQSLILKKIQTLRKTQL